MGFVLKRVLTGVKTIRVATGLGLCRGEFIMAGETHSQGLAGLVLQNDLPVGARATYHLATLATVVLQGRARVRAGWCWGSMYKT